MQGKSLKADSTKVSIIANIASVQSTIKHQAGQHFTELHFSQENREAYRATKLSLNRHTQQIPLQRDHKAKCHFDIGALPEH